MQTKTYQSNHHLPAKAGFGRLVTVALPLPIPKEFIYNIPEGFSKDISIGKRVVVPFGRRIEVGYAVGFPNKSALDDIKDIKDIQDVLGDKPVFDEIRLKFFKWMSLYYFSTLGEILKLVHPPKSKKRVPKNNKTAFSQEDFDIQEEILHEPNAEQSCAVSKIIEGVKTQSFSPFLLHGITGSGKTLVYLKILEETIAMGKKGIALVPEIALTYGISRCLIERFGSRVAVMHSRISEGERHEQWKKIMDGDIDVVIGARSALFAPLTNIGIIIVDEEHDTSYKQEEGVRYNARDCSVMLAKFLNIAVVLGSATPSLETFHNAKSGKINLLTLSKRVENKDMPDIEVVDMREKSQESGVKSQESKILSKRLINLLEDALNKKQQAILFLNRRGFANFLICKDCGYVFKCSNCSVSMTFHKKQNIIKCHYCGLSMSAPSFCQGCKGYNVKTMGIGTERVEEEIRRLFPDVKTERMDRDTTSRKGAHSRILGAIEKGEADILIGTQMVAKGHHFSNVTVMGIILADTMMNIPDFRSAEKTFQILIQAAGRAGRGDIHGKVVIQTFNPRHYCFNSIINHDYTSFLNEEMEKREELHYPPFHKLINMRIEGNKEDKVIKGANTLKKIADRYIKRFKGDIVLLGPAPAFLSFLRGRYRWHMLVKGNNVKTLHDFIHSIKNGFEQNKISGIELVIDVDPMTTI